MMQRDCKCLDDFWPHQGLSGSIAAVYRSVQAPLPRKVPYLYARDMVTAKGSPSGTATTMMVTPKMKKSRILFGSSLLKPLF